MIAAGYARKWVGSVAPLRPLPVISEPFLRVAMDFTGPLRTKGGNIILSY